MKPSFCSACGSSITQDTEQTWTCQSCQHIHYQNPTPVAVAVVPVLNEANDVAFVLGVQRGIAPKIGEMALPSGFVDKGEDAQRAAAREVMEETGLIIDASQGQLKSSYVTPNGTQLLLGVEFPPISWKRYQKMYAAFSQEKHPETQSVVLLERGSAMAFPLHVLMMETYLNMTPSNHKKLDP